VTNPDAALPDEWDRVLSHLNDEHHVTPIQFGDLTFPQVLCLWSHGKATDEDAEAVVRAKKAVADFKSGKYRWDD
jgi:hypothetical protein